MVVDKYGNYVRKCMWQLCRWDRVDICMTFHLIFFIQGVSAKTFEPNISVICQRIFMKF
jgi:hypothetical protein